MPILTLLGDFRRALLKRAHRREITLNSDRPLVTFSFDDFPRNALTEGGMILRTAGARGTYYAAFGLMGKVTEVGPSFVEEDLHRLIEEGHELASHTYSNVHARRSRVDDYLNEMMKGHEALVKRVGKMTSGNFSYPFGEVTYNLKAKIGTTLNSCRGIFRGLNGPKVDLNLLLANRLYGDLEALEAACSLIRENAQKKRWLIFYTHDVQTSPSPYGCTPRLLERVVECARQSGSGILTVSEVLRLAQSADKQSS